MASKKGASKWFVALPLKRYGLMLTKSEFRYGFFIRYKILATSTPFNCLCGKKFKFAQMRHNEIRETFAKVMHGVYYDVEIEPALQLLQGESFIKNLLHSSIDDSK